MRNVLIDKMKGTHRHQEAWAMISSFCAGKDTFLFSLPTFFFNPLHIALNGRFKYRRYPGKFTAYLFHSGYVFRINDVFASADVKRNGIFTCICKYQFALFNMGIRNHQCRNFTARIKHRETGKADII